MSDDVKELDCKEEGCGLKVRYTATETPIFKEAMPDPVYLTCDNGHVHAYLV